MTEDVSALPYIPSTDANDGRNEPRRYDSLDFGRKTSRYSTIDTTALPQPKESAHPDYFEFSDKETPRALRRMDRVKVIDKEEAFRGQMIRLDRRAEQLASRREKLDSDEGECERRERELESKVKSCKDQEVALQATESELQDYTARLRALKSELDNRQDDIDQRSRYVAGYAAQLQDISDGAYGRDGEFNKQCQKLDFRAEHLKCRRTELDRQEEELDRLEAASVRRAAEMGEERNGSATQSAKDVGGAGG